MRVIKPNIQRLTDYAVEQGLTRVKLNQNESPFDIPDFLKEQILNRMTVTSWNRYPPGRATALIRAISDYTRFPASGIMVGNGSNEIIQTLIYSTCDTGDQILLVKPSFSIYKRIASIMNIDVMEIPLLKDFQFDIPSLIEAGQNAQILMLSTPNNPTGTTLQPDQVKEIAANVPCLVAVDEAYFEFSQKTVQPFLEGADNMVILRTFSKALRLANLRIGYLLGQPNLVNHLVKCRLPFSIGSFQQIAGEFILKNEDTLIPFIDAIKRERDRIYNELNKMGSIIPIPSEANFILFKILSIYGEDLYNSLYHKGVLIRHFDDSLLENWLRVTIGTPEENNLFLDVLGEVVGEK